MLPLPNFEVRAELPSVLRVIDPEPNGNVVPLRDFDSDGVRCEGSIAST